MRISKILPCIFVNHGGGPMHLYGGSDDPIKNHLLNVGSRFSPENAKPKSILILSAHNEAAPSLRISSASTHYDEYHAVGDPELANRVQHLLGNSNITSDLDTNDVLDHGALAPLMIAFPKADIPVVALSLHASLNPQIHLNIGEALRPLREEGVLIIGSGMSFHNLGALFATNIGRPKGYDFDQTLTEAITNPDPVHRNEILKTWESFPEARNAHPREDHLMPLFVVTGAAGSDIGKQSDSFEFMGASVSGFSFQ